MRRCVRIGAGVVAAGLSLAGCGGGGGGAGPGGATVGAVNVQGTVAGRAAQAAEVAPLPESAVVTMVNEAGQSASQVVTPADGRFSLSVPAGHDYVVVLREAGAAGRTLGILVVNEASGRRAFSLPPGSGDVDLGAITVDPKRGTARSASALALADSARALPDTDGDGIPDLADISGDEDGDGVADSEDAFAFDEAESKDSDRDGEGDNGDPDDDDDGIADAEDGLPTDPLESADADHDGIGDNADPDDDNDGVADARDALPTDPSERSDSDGDGTGDNADPDDDDDGVADAEDAFPGDPGEWSDTDGDGVGDNADPDDDNDRVADVRDGFPADPAEWADTDGDGIGNNADRDDDGDGLLDVDDPSPRVAGVGAIVAPVPLLNPLNQTAVPEPPQLARYVKNKPAAIRLGKAFFWDMQAGSDGIVACATCHFRAGADPRTKNQLNPGLLAGDTVFGNNRSGGLDFPRFGPNYALEPGDFPLHVREPPEIHTSTVVRDTNDVVGSQGVRLSRFVRVVPGSAVEDVIPLPDPIFNAGGVNTRRVTPRHAPTVIDAVFNFVNFWDGRANFLFNGENSFGPADPDAGVWFNDPVQGLVKRPVHIEFASLASQAVSPPLNDFEMSARGRTFPLIGRKLLSLTPLGKQLVHPGESVLGPLSNATAQPGGGLAGNGLRTTYAQLIQDAFVDDLWNSPERTPDGFTHLEANFSLFWGLAIQLYEATLVSDQTPFDRWLAGDEGALTEQQKLGFSLFTGIGNCTACHAGIEFTTIAASFIAFLDNTNNGTIEAMSVADGTPVIYDDGFNNTGLTPTNDDLGRGGTAPFLNPRNGRPYPLSFSRLAELQELNLLPFETAILPSFAPWNMAVSADGSFKVPGLRNVALTPPYFHNGSVGTLDQVLDFYARGGNFPEENLRDLDPLIGALSLLQDRHPFHLALAAFLDALTDPRVVAESAPFDHPELFVPEGDPEVLLRIPARAADGRAAP